MTFPGTPLHHTIASATSPTLFFPLTSCNQIFDVCPQSKKQTWLILYKHTIIQQKSKLDLTRALKILYGTRICYVSSLYWHQDGGMNFSRLSWNKGWRLFLLTSLQQSILDFCIVCTKVRILLTQSTKNLCVKPHFRNVNLREHLHLQCELV